MHLMGEVFLQLLPELFAIASVLLWPGAPVQGIVEVIQNHKGDVRLEPEGVGLDEGGDVVTLQISTCSLLQESGLDSVYSIKVDVVRGGYACGFQSCEVYQVSII